MTTKQEKSKPRDELYQQFELAVHRMSVAKKLLQSAQNSYTLALADMTRASSLLEKHILGEE